MSRLRESSSGFSLGLASVSGIAKVEYGAGSYSKQLQGKDTAMSRAGSLTVCPETLVLLGAVLRLAFLKTKAF